MFLSRGVLLDTSPESPDPEVMTCLACAFLILPGNQSGRRGRAGWVRDVRVMVRIRSEHKQNITKLGSEWIYDL